MLMLKKKSIFWIGGCFLIFLILLMVFLLRIKEEMVDFSVNYQAAKRIQSGETLYRFEDGHYQFKYPPFASFLYIPLSLLPLPVAKGIWYYAILTSIFFAVRISLHLVSPQKALLLTSLSVLVLAKFFGRELQLGQINTIVSLFLLVMISKIHHSKSFDSLKKEYWAGLFWGLATSLKPYTLIFLPYFLVKKRWKVLLMGILFLILAFLAPSFFYGFKGNLVVHSEYIKTFFRSTPKLLSSQDNISILALAMKWTAKENFSLLFYLFSLFLISLVFLYMVLKGKKIENPTFLEGAILLMLIPLVSPLGWDYTLTSSLLAVMILLRHFFDFSRKWRIFLGWNFFLIAFSLYDLMGRKLYKAFMNLSILTIISIILFGYLCSLRLRSYC